MSCVTELYVKWLRKLAFVEIDWLCTVLMDGTFVHEDFQVHKCLQLITIDASHPYHRSKKSDRLFCLSLKLVIVAN